VILISPEEDPATTIVPRLIRSGADMDRVLIVHGVSADAAGAMDPLSFSEHTNLLRAATVKYGDVRAVIVDPISSSLGEGVNDNKNAQVRRVLQPSIDLAREKDFALIWITHLNKPKGEPSRALDRLLGSVAFGNLARSVLIVDVEPGSDDVRLVLPAKCNVGKYPPGLRFKIAGPEGEPGTVQWVSGSPTIRADELVADAGQGRARERQRAVAFLRRVLAAGPRPSKEVEELAVAEGINEGRLKDAKTELGVIPEKGRGSKTSAWTMRLPEHKVAA
jgi:putative DNA primase/helicase